MLVPNYKRINEKLRNLSGRNQPGAIFVDNLHCPYIQFEKKFVLPSTSLVEDDPQSLESFLDILIEHLPEALEGTSILPEPRPKRETGKLFFVRPILFGPNSFLYIFSTDMIYLGGARTEEIKKQSSQNRTTSVITDRIYFQVKFIQTSFTIQEGDDTVDFEAKRFSGGVFRVESERDEHKPIRKFSEIFDEVDFSDTEAKIREELEITPEIWRLGKIYSPIGIDYLSLAMRFLQPSLPKSFRSFRQFHSILTDTETGVSKDVLKEYHSFLSLFQAERTQSKSGNMLWKVNQVLTDE